MSNSRCRILTILLLQIWSIVFGDAAQGGVTSVSAASEPSGASGPDYTGPSAGSDECDPEMVGFELVTGYVYTAPTNLLESISGILMLTDCLETCQANDSCQAVNYETGLCVLFSSNADNNPGKRHMNSPLIAFNIFIKQLLWITGTYTNKSTLEWKTCLAVSKFIFLGTNNCRSVMCVSCPFREIFIFLVSVFFMGKKTYRRYDKKHTINILGNLIIHSKIYIYYI